jgi:hypothetical protein
MKLALEINKETYIIITQNESPLLGEVCSAFRRILIMAGYPPEALTVKDEYDEL